MDLQHSTPEMHTPEMQSSGQFVLLLVRELVALGKGFFPWPRSSQPHHKSRILAGPLHLCCAMYSISHAVHHVLLALYNRFWGEGLEATALCRKGKKTWRPLFCIEGRLLISIVLRRKIHTMILLPPRILGVMKV